MIYIANFVQKVNLSSTNKTIISFGENFVFAVALQKESFGFIFFIEIIKGVFEITNITATNPIGEVPIIYNKDKRTFYKSLFLDKDLEKITYTFYISANIELKEVCAVNYHLHVPAARLRLLKVYHYFKDEIVLPGYDGLKFTCFVKKIKNNESDGCDIELQVKNPYDVEIEGKKGDFVIVQYGTKNIDLTLSFVFYPTILQNFNGNSTNVAKTAVTPILHQHPALKTTPETISKLQTSQPKLPALSNAQLTPTSSKSALANEGKSNPVKETSPVLPQLETNNKNVQPKV